MPDETHPRLSAPPLMDGQTHTPISVVLLVFGSAPSAQQFPKLRALIEETFSTDLDRFGSTSIVDPTRIVILYPHPGQVSRAQLQEELVKRAYALIANVEARFHMELTIGVSAPCYNTANLQTYVEQCQSALHAQMFDGASRVFLYQRQRFSVIPEGYYLDDFESALFCDAPFDQALLQEKLNVFFDTLRISRPGREDLHNELFQFVVLIYTYCFRHGISFYSLFSLKYPEPAMLDHFSTLDSVQTCFNACLGTLHDLLAEPPAPHRKEIRRLIEYIHRNYASDITLASVSDYVQISPNYICKIFKEETGVNFKSYVNLVRITQAKRLLLTTGDSIGEIAEQVGFHNVSYFCRIFKDSVGVTALQFRSPLS